MKLCFTHVSTTWPTTWKRPFWWLLLERYSGLIGIVWVLLAFYLIYDSPEIHPRISFQELSYLEPYCLKMQDGRKVMFHSFFSFIKCTVFMIFTVFSNLITVMQIAMFYIYLVLHIEHDHIRLIN